MKWLFIIGLVLLAGLLFLAAIADVPCQDGSWDEAKGKCVPYPASNSGA